jgi:Carbohydrate-selective porin, OprB family/S-layer homology domain
MHKFLVKSLVVCPVILVAFALSGNAAEVPANQDLAMGQVTSVSQLSDVKPSDWAFQSLQSLVERYGCIAGYPNGTFQGKRAMTRYEFAAGLNACMDRVSELITSNTSDLVKNEDLEILQRLQEEFSDELVTLRGRVDKLESRTSKVEAQQFSTTTKLRGEVIFAAASAFGTDKARNTDQINSNAAKSKVDDNLILADRVRLNFDTTFTGKDRLRVRLQARNVTPFNSAVTGTNQTRLGFDGAADGAIGNNDVNAAVVSYRFPIGQSTTVHVGAAGLEYVDEVPIMGRGFDPSGSGALSRCIS